MQANIADLSLGVHLYDSVVEGLYGGGVVGAVGWWGPHGHLRDLVWDLEGGVLGGEHAGRDGDVAGRAVAIQLRVFSNKLLHIGKVLHDAVG